MEEYIGMENIGSTAKVNLALQHNKRFWTAARYLVQKSADHAHFTSPVLAELNSVDGGSYKSVIDFVNWAKTNYPAKRYALVLWGHGSGWEEHGTPKPGTRGIIYDGASNHIRNFELRKIFETTGRVNLFIAAACTMQMAEVAYEIRDYADVILGSEELFWGPAFFYEPLARTLDAAPDAAPATVAATMLGAYKQVFAPGTQAYTDTEKTDTGRTYSALNAKALNELSALLSGWTKAVIAANETGAVKYAVNNVLRFGLPGYGSQSPDMARDYANFADLYHFVELTASRANSADVKAKSAELEKFISSKLVIANMGLFRRNHGDYTANAHGISIETPSRRGSYPNPLPQESSYRDSSTFAKDSGWADFLDWAKAR
jgi:hypothetical protein